MSASEGLGHPAPSCSVVNHLGVNDGGKQPGENEVTLGSFLTHTVLGLQLQSSALLASLCDPGEAGHP